MSANVSYDNVTVDQTLTLINLATITSACDLQVTAGTNQHLILTTSGTGNTRLQTGSLSKTLFAGTVTYSAAVGVNTIPLFKAIFPTNNSLGDIKIYLKTSDQLSGLKFEEFCGSVQAINTTMYQLAVCGSSSNMGFSNMQALGKSNATGASIVTFVYTFSVAVASTLVAWFFVEWYGDNATVFSPINFPTVVNTSAIPVSSSGANSNASSGTTSSASGTKLSSFVDDITPPLYAAVNSEAGSLSAILAQVTGQNGSLTSSNSVITTHTGSLSSMNATITSINSITISLTQSVSSQNAVIISSSASLTSLTNAIAPLSNLGTFVSASLTALTNVVSANSSSLSSLQNTVSTTAANATTATASITSLSNTVNTQSQVVSALSSSVTTIQVAQSQISSSVSGISTTLINQTATIQAFGGSITVNAANIGTLQLQGSLNSASITALTIRTGSFSTLLNNMQIVESALGGSVTSVTANLATLTMNTGILASSVSSLQNFGKGQILFAEPFYAIDAVDTIASGTSLPALIVLPDNGNLTVVSSGTTSTYQTDTPALRFVGAVQLTVDLTQPPYYLSFSTLNTYIAAGYRIYISFKVSVSRGGGTVLASPWPNTAFRLLLNTTSSTDSTSNMIVDIPNTSAVQTDQISNQIDVTALFSSLTNAILTIYTNITTPNYLNLYSLALSAGPANQTAVNLAVSGTASVAGLLATGTTSGVLGSFGTITGSTLNMSGANFINLGSDQVKAVYAGNIGYQISTVGAVDIFGAGPSVGSRNLKLWDNINVPGSVSAGTGTVSGLLNTGTTTGVLGAFNAITGTTLTVGTVAAGSVSSTYASLTTAAASTLTVASLTVSTSARAANKFLQSFDKTLGTLTNDSANICNISASNGGFIVELSLVQSVLNNMVSKVYQIPFNWNATSGNWYRCLPFSQNYGWSSTTVDVDCQMTNGTATLRLVRSTAGGTQSGFTAAIRASDSSNANVIVTNDTTVVLGATGSVSNSGIYSNTPLTTSGGNIGIMTNFPSYPLDVSGSARVSNSLQIDGLGPNINITAANPGDMVVKAYSNPMDRYGLGQYASSTTRVFSSGLIGTTSAVCLSVAGTGSSAAGTFTDVLTVRGTSGTGTLSTQGNVGINTTSPLYSLDVNGSARITGTLNTASLSSSFGSLTQAYTATLSVGTILNFSAGGSIGTNLALSGTLTSSSLSSIFGSLTQAYTATLSVGTILNFSAGGSIGTNLYLTGTLTCASLSATFLNAVTLSAGTYLNVVFNQSISSSGTTSGTYSTGTLTVNGGGSFMGTVIATGLGINQTSLSYPLDVNGSARLNNALFSSISTSLLLSNQNQAASVTTAFALYQGPNGDTVINSGFGFPLEFKIGNVEYGRFSSLGQLGLNTTNPSYLLDVNGSARFTGSHFIDATGPCINLTAANPGDMVVKAYANSMDRYGIGQYVSSSYSSQRLFTSGSNGTLSVVALSLAGTGSGANGTFTDVLVVRGLTGQGTLSTSGNVGINTSFPAFALDVSGSAQISSGLNIPGTNTLNFGYDQTKQVDAGKIGYQTFDSGCLNIVGAGTTGGLRTMKLYDNVIVNTSLTIAGQIAQKAVRVWTGSMQGPYTTDWNQVNATLSLAGGIQIVQWSYSAMVTSAANMGVAMCMPAATYRAPNNMFCNTANQHTTAPTRVFQMNLSAGSYTINFYADKQAFPNMSSDGNDNLYWQVIEYPT